MFLSENAKIFFGLAILRPLRRFFDNLPAGGILVPIFEE